MIQDIIDFNIIGGKSAGDPKRFDERNIEKHLRLLEDEVEELNGAIYNEPVENMAKEAGDVIVVAVGLLHALGFDAEKVMNAVNKSNLSKFTSDGKLAKESQEVLETVEGVKTHLEFIKGHYAMVSSEDQVGKSNNKEYPKGKILKMICYSEADLAGCEYDGLG